MSDTMTQHQISIPFAQNPFVQELLGILNENGKDTTELLSFLGYVKGMEDFVTQVNSNITDMKSQLDKIQEVQNHPIKTKLRSAIKALETSVVEVKSHWAELKTKIIDGCHRAVKAFKESGITALDNLASFFHVKPCLQAMKNSIIKSINTCDKTMKHINAFANEYHSAGRALKNMARIAVGKKPIDTAKEAGKLARLISSPYRSRKSRLVDMRKSVNSMLGKLGKLEQKAETVRSERSASLLKRLDEKKEKVRQQVNLKDCMLMWELPNRQSYPVIGRPSIDRL